MSKRPWTHTEREKAPAARNAAIIVLIGIICFVLSMPTFNYMRYPDIIKRAFFYGLDFALYVRNTFPSSDWAAFSFKAINPLFGVLWFAIAFFIAVVVFLQPRVKRTKYGDSELGTLADAKDQELRAKEGQVLGEMKGKILRPEEIAHTGVISPTGGGKSAATVIPTAIDYPGSMIVVSTKNELKKLLGPYAEKTGKAYYISWADTYSEHAWSMGALSSLPVEDAELERYIIRICAQFFPKDEKGSDPYWSNTADRFTQALFFFEALEAIRESRDALFASVLNTLADARRDMEEEQRKAKEAGKEEDFRDPFGEALRLMAANSDHYGYPRKISMTLEEWAGMKWEQRSQHLSSIATGINIITYLSVQGSTTRSDFSFDDLRREKTTVFLQLPSSDKEAFGKLTSIFFEALIAYGLDNGWDKDRHPILMIGDEFRSYPKIANLADLTAQGRSQGIHIMIVLQALSTIYEKYDKAAEEIVSNLKHIVAMAPNDETFTKKYTPKVGKRTDIKKTTSGGIMKITASTLTQTDEGVDLIPEQEWGNIPKGHHMLLTNRHWTRPLYVESPMWFTHYRYWKHIPWKERCSWQTFKKNPFACLPLGQL